MFGLTLRHIRMDTLGALLVVVLLSACGMFTNPAPSASCEAKTAQIAVYEGGFKRICGCNEPGGVSFTIPQVMTCTIPAGTTVFFSYISLQGDHTLFIGSVASFTTRNASNSSGIDARIFSSASQPSFTLGDFPSNPSGGVIIVQ